MKKRYFIASFALSLLLFASSLLQAQQTFKRLVLLEQFTNTYCPNCILDDPEFISEVVDKYEETEILHITYHPPVPIQDDVFYQANPFENEERFDYYNTPGTPAIMMMGTYIPKEGTTIFPVEVLEPEFVRKSNIDISASEIINGKKRKVKIKLAANSTPPQGNLKLKVVAVERKIVYEPPYEGMATEMHNTFRVSLGGWDGETFAVFPNGKTEYEFDYTIAQNWDAEQIYVIAFIQNEDTKEIYNAASSWNHREEMTTAIPASSSEKTAIEIYPNPAKDMVKINLQNTQHTGKVQLFDTEGRMMLSHQFQGKSKLDLAGFADGIYFIQIHIKETNEVFTTRIIKAEGF